MLRITAPEPVTGRVGSVRFVDGVAEVEQVTAAERLFLSTRGYRIEDAATPTDSWRKDDIAAWAASRGIDTEGAETKAELLAAIDAAPRTRARVF